MMSVSVAAERLQRDKIVVGREGGSQFFYPTLDSGTFRKRDSKICWGTVLVSFILNHLIFLLIFSVSHLKQQTLK
jgi:hypothetical protein